MEFDSCHHCGIQYSTHNLFKVEDKLKKNTLCFKNAFVNEKKEFLKPKFCKACQKKWLKLENKRGDDIKKYISDLKGEIKNNSGQNVTLVDDDHLAEAGPSGVKKQRRNFSNNNDNVSIDDVTLVYEEQHMQVKRKVTVRHYSYDKRETTSVLPNLKVEESAIEEKCSKNKDKVTDNLLATLDKHENQKVRKSESYVHENESKHSQSMLYTNEDTSVPDDRFDEPKESKIDDRYVKHCKDLAQPGPSQISNDPVNENSNIKQSDNEKNELKDYEYWKLLYQKTWFSAGIDAETREKFEYYLKKMKEAEQFGFAEDEEKNYNYWYDLFLDRFKSDRIDNECKEDLEYFSQMMKVTKKDSK